MLYKNGNVNKLLLLLLLLQNPYQERNKLSQCLHLPQNYLTAGGKAGRASNPPPLAQGLDPPLITTIFSVVE